MVFKKFFSKKKANDTDYDSLMIGMIFLSKKTQEYFREEDLEHINPITLGVFFGAFNSACYLVMRETPSSSDMAKFRKHVIVKVTDTFIGNNPNLSKKNKDEISGLILQLYSQRVDEYTKLIRHEMNKPRGTSVLVDLTCEVLDNLFDDETQKDERYDPIFSALILNHINKFKKLLLGHYNS